MLSAEAVAGLAFENFEAKTATIVKKSFFTANE